MALEASDLNDGNILAATKQETNDQGWIRYSVTLPTGTLLRSEFINPDNAKQALYSWIETVKQQAVAAAKAEQAEKRAIARRGKMDIERKEGDDKPLFRAGGGRPSEELEAMNKVITHGAELKAREAVHSDGSMQASDPLKYAQQQYELHYKKVEELRPQLKAFEAGLTKWTIILETLETGETND